MRRRCIEIWNEIKWLKYKNSDCLDVKNFFKTQKILGKEKPKL